MNVVKKSVKNLVHEFQEEPVLFLLLWALLPLWVFIMFENEAYVRLERRMSDWYVPFAAILLMSFIFIFFFATVRILSVPVFWISSYIVVAKFRSEFVIFKR